MDMHEWQERNERPGEVLPMVQEEIKFEAVNRYVLQYWLCRTHICEICLSVPILQPAILSTQLDM